MKRFRPVAHKARSFFVQLTVFISKKEIDNAYSRATYADGKSCARLHACRLGKVPPRPKSGYRL